MLIKDIDIKKRDVVGQAQNGTPILMVETKGGLFAVFANVNGKIEPISAMNHIGLAYWLAEKKMPTALWDTTKIKNWYEG